ncbi:MAG: hypothetical protein PHI47_10520 [Sulfuricurvum sp.]|uniref:hypothetical protein n=1 Tax=Sulfuricurvum sp. TaxID=2025608 RepID=UPI0026378D7F|nr:hypothetical protein [Sulfuricurvum sp.]MDD5160475.1 hypothetical protein [Sulfuricurvum sp.]
MKKQILFIVIFSITMWPDGSHAGLLKWFKKEALPTITGQRPVEIKAYISVKSGSTQIKFGQDSAMIKVGGVTLQTSKLRQRLAQAGCVYATGGDIMACAPDLIDREARKLFSDIASGTDTTVSTVGGNGASDAGTVGLKFEDAKMKEVQWGPPSASVGFDFSNPGTASTSPPAPSAFLHTIAVTRGANSAGRAVVGIVGRADFAFMTGRRGGILCLFASEKKKYLKSINGQYSDPYGLVAVGGSTIVERSPDLIPIQLSIPWSELYLPDDDDPYAPKFVQCHITVDNQVMQSTEWIEF